MPNTELKCDIWKAAKAGKLEEVQKCVAEGVSVNAKSRGNVTPLHEAAENGHATVIEWLLDQGANVNSRTASESGYPGAETPLHLAVQANHERVVKLLLKRGGKVNAKSSDGETALEAATRIGSLPLVSLLLENGAEINPRGDTNPLQTALSMRQLEIAEFLIKYGAQIDRKTPPDSGSLLMLTAFSKWLPGVNLLLSHSSDLNETDQNGWTALHWQY